MPNIYLNAFLLGLAIAAPVGPIGLLCIQRSLKNGFLSGLMTGLGAAVADGVFATIAALGLNFIINFLLANSHIINLLGAVFICYLGWKNFNNKQVSVLKQTIAKKYNSLGDFLSSFILTLTNPVTIILFLGVFSGLGLLHFSHEKSYLLNSIQLVTGITNGSLAWWLILSSLISIFHKHISTKGLIIINQFSGISLISFGTFYLYKNLSAMFI